TVPAEANVRTSPFVSVIVTIVLLKVALMWAIPRLTLRRCLRLATLTSPPLYALTASPTRNTGADVTCAFPSRPSSLPRSCAGLGGSGHWCASVGHERASYGDGAGRGSSRCPSTERYSAAPAGEAGLRPCIPGRGWLPAG